MGWFGLETSHLAPGEEGGSEAVFTAYPHNQRPDFAGPQEYHLTDLSQSTGCSHEFIQPFEHNIALQSL